MLNPNRIRSHVLDMIYQKQSGHIGASFSIAEAIAYLYSTFDLVSQRKDRDRLILSKGHSVPIIYAALYEMGLITDLSTFREVDSPLQGHPDKVRCLYIDASTGSLGQGPSIAIGHALASKLLKFNNRVFCVIGDGEMQEGQVWEALMFAPKYKLNNLTYLIDYNGAQNDGYVSEILDLGDLATKIKAFGWDCWVINGHDIAEIKAAVEAPSQGPRCVILKTIKGYGVSFMQTPAWHVKVPTAQEYADAKEELQC